MTTPASATARPPRRRLGLVLALLPAAAGVAYALAHQLLQRDPTLLEAAPPAAAWVERWRHLSVFGVFGAMREEARDANGQPDAVGYVQAMGERINVPDLVGVNPKAPLLRWREEPAGPVPREGLALPLTDPARFEKRFREHGIDLSTPRHAMWLDVRGSLGIVTTAPPAAQSTAATWHLADEGEDLAVVADVGRLVSLALAEMGSGTYDALLAGLGVARTDAAARAADPSLPPVTGTERLARLPASWRSARLWLRLGDATHLPSARVELELNETPFADAWRRLLTEVGDSLTWTPPPDGDVRVFASVSGGRAPDLLRLTAYSLGADLPALDGITAEEVGRDGPLWPASGWVLMRAQGREEGAWAAAARDAAPPPPAWFGLVSSDTAAVQRAPGAWRIEAGGHEAARAADRLSAQLVTASGKPDVEGADEATRPGRRLVRAVLRRAAAWEFLGPTLLRAGALLTPFDGRPLILDVRATESGLVVYVDVHDS